MRSVGGGRDAYLRVPRTARLSVDASPFTGARVGGPVRAVSAYLAASALAVAVALAVGRNPLACTGWLGTQGPAACLLSLGLGVLTAACTIGATHAMVHRWRWARELCLALRPAAQGTGEAGLVAIAIASASGEELLFRGLLVPVVGVLASSLLFGVLHQVRGPARWAWAGWATVMGLVFGSVFAATGSLAGPLFAHAAINHANLRFLRDSSPVPRRLGGLLGR